MRKLMTILMCGLFAYAGFYITSGKYTISEVPFKQNTLAAATIPYQDVNRQLPIDLLLDEAKRMGKDTVKIEVHDTVKVDNIKYVRVRAPKHATDTFYINTTELPEVVVGPVKNKSPGDSAVNEPVIVLTVDGKVVYQTTESAFDEP